ncbi:MAG TPA: DUF488 family protein [bacterium]|nr:DUF488 family protein [bacterium]
MIQIKRAYDEVTPEDGKRVLVDRLWPRGKSKEHLQLTEWVKEVAPSNELRKWFHQDRSKWAEFKQRYFQELQSHREDWKPLLQMARDETLTLIYSARDREQNNAIALKEFLESRLEQDS